MTIITIAALVLSSIAIVASGFALWSALEAEKALTKHILYVLDRDDFVEEVKKMLLTKNNVLAKMEANICRLKGELKEKSHPE